MFKMTRTQASPQPRMIHRRTPVRPTLVTAARTPIKVVKPFSPSKETGRAAPTTATPPVR